MTQQKRGQRQSQATVTGWRRTRANTSLSSKLDLDSAFFWLLLSFLITAFTFLSLRDRHLSLNPLQIAEYERRSQYLSNSTVYIVEVGQPEELLSKLPRKDWGRVSVDIDYVAFVWDDLALFLTEEWVVGAEAALGRTKRVEIALFGCGCVVPNHYFRNVEQRLAGYECLLLPGWVLDEKDVHWVDVGGWSDKCAKREAVLGASLAKRFKKELAEIGSSVRETNDEEGKRGDGQVIDGGDDATKSSTVSTTTR